MIPRTITIEDVIAATRKLEALGEGLAGCILAAKEAISEVNAFGLGVKFVSSPYVPDGHVYIIRPPKPEPLGGFMFISDPVGDAKPAPLSIRMEYGLPIAPPKWLTIGAMPDLGPTVDEMRASRAYWRGKKRAFITAARKARKKRRLYLRHVVRVAARG